MLASRRRGGGLAARDNCCARVYFSARAVRMARLTRREACARKWSLFTISLSFASDFVWCVCMDAQNMYQIY
jgi:hypothetical protein